MIAISGLGLASSAAPARADGDPASDVLVGQPLFLPQDARVPPVQQAQLGAILDGARRSGYQIRVAVIASSADLGAITELWRRPQSYARFLAQELALVYRGPVLVVMPNGYGVASSSGPSGAAERRALAGLRPPAAELGTAALTAVQRLAKASGHALAVPRAAAPAGAGSTPVLPWIVFGLGGVLIAAAWAGSLRARPVRTHGTGPSSP